MSFLALVLAASTFVRPLERVSTMDPAAAQSAYDARAIQFASFLPFLKMG